MNIMKRIWSSFVGGRRCCPLISTTNGTGRNRQAGGLLVARGDPEDRDDLGLMGLGVGDVGAGAAAEPAGGFVVADEDARVALAVAVLDPDFVPLLEPVLDRVVAHRRNSSASGSAR